VTLTQFQNIILNVPPNVQIWGDVEAAFAYRLWGEFRTILGGVRIIIPNTRTVACLEIRPETVVIDSGGGPPLEVEVLSIHGFVMISCEREHLNDTPMGRPMGGIG
jgi:hypothetical protein